MYDRRPRVLSAPCKLVFGRQLHRNGLPKHQKLADQFYFLGNRGRIMIIDLDINIDHHYQSNSVCRVRFLTIELEKIRINFRDQILFLGNRARIMVIMLDIHIEYHY